VKRGKASATKTTITFQDSPRLRAKHFSLSHRYLDELRRAWDDKQLVLMLGAGLSQPYGLPGWDALILDLLLDSGPEIVSHKSDPRALLGWIVDYLKMSPTVLGRVAQVTMMSACGHGGSRRLSMLLLPRCAKFSIDAFIPRRHCKHRFTGPQS